MNKTQRATRQQLNSAKLHIDAVLRGAIGCQQVDLSRCSRRTSSLLRVPHHLASKKD